MDVDDWPEPWPSPALLHAVLGPDGLAGVPLITHAEIVATATELTARLMQVDDCWVQPAGAFTESLGRAADGTGGAWLGNSNLHSSVPAGSVRFRGALGGAPFLVGGERQALMVFSAASRAWTTVDHTLLREAAAELGAALELTIGHQRTPAQEARTRYDELRSELLTVLNHELRTPLTALSAGVEMLLDMAEVLPGPVGRLVARMEPNLARLLQLSANVTVLGDVATPQSRLDAARFEPADVVEVVRLCLTTLDGVADRRVAVFDEGGRPLVAAPVADLRELLDRVLGNAVKFSGPGGWLTVGVECRSSRVAVVITDSGPGVPEHEEHAVGQPFYRASNARELQTPGAGLGLAAASAIARRWGGSVELHTGDQGGGVVTVRLPAAERRSVRPAVVYDAAPGRAAR